MELVNIIKQMDLIISVNTAVVHIGYALDKKMIILCGPSLDIWTPKGKNIETIHDEEALFLGADKFENDNRFATINRINYMEIEKHLKYLLGK